MQQKIISNCDLSNCLLLRILVHGQQLWETSTQSGSCRWVVGKYLAPPSSGVLEELEYTYKNGGYNLEVKVATMIVDEKRKDGRVLTWKGSSTLTETVRTNENRPNIMCSSQSDPEMCLQSKDRLTVCVLGSGWEAFSVGSCRILRFGCYFNACPVRFSGFFGVSNFGNRL